MFFSKKIITSFGILSLYVAQFTFVFIMVAQSVQAVGYNQGSLYEWQIKKKNTATTVKKSFSGLIAPDGGDDSGVININVNSTSVDPSNTEYRTLLRGSNSAQLMFTITDASSTIAGAEYRVEDSSGVVLLEGSPLTAEDGAFDEKEELALSNVNTADWKPSTLPYTIYVRAKDVAGNWSNETPVKVSVGGALSTWNFNESKWTMTKGAVVDSSGSNNATAFGGVFQVSAPDAESPYLDFDGQDDYISTGIPFTSTKDLSISAWYKTNNIVKSKMALVGGNNGGSFEVYIHEGKPGCRVWDTTERSIYASSAPQKGKWHHVVCAQHFGDNPETRLYVDGELKAKTLYASVSKGGIWHIGKQGSSLASFYQGKADSVSFYDIALNEEQAQNIYQKEKILFSNLADEPSSIIGKWLFNEDSSSFVRGQIFDSSGLNHHGIAFGGVSQVSAADAESPYLNFDGKDDYMATGILFIIYKDSSISAWYKTNDWNRERMSLVGTSKDGFSGIYIHKGKPGCRIWDKNERSIYVKELPTIGKWHHVVCTRHYGDKPETRLYVDGQLKEKTPFASISNEGFWNLGKPGSPGANYYRGKADSFTIYDVVLNDEQVQNNYQKEKVLFSDSADIISEIIGEWLFNENSWSSAKDQVLDKSEFENHGMAVGGVQTFKINKENRVAEFDGVNDYIATPINYFNAYDLTNVSTDLTISAWYKTTDFAGYKRRVIVGGNAGGRFEIFLDKGIPGCRVFDTSDKSIYASKKYLGEWTHIACVQKYGAAPKTELYINGVLVASTPNASIALGGKWFIGKSGSGQGTYFKGSIDHPIIKLRALSAEEISATYTESVNDYVSLKVEIPAPSALWNFNETSWTGKAGEVIDPSGNNQHGTAKNGAIPIAGISDLGNVGKFDGKDDYVATPMSYNPNTGITLSAWYKTKERITSRMAIIGGNNGGRFEMFINMGRPGCRVYDTEDKSIVSLSLAVDVWHHIACVQTYGPSPKTLLYVDGLLKRSISAASIPIGGLWKIGASGSTLGTYFDGYIDEPAIYKTELSAEEINELFKSQKENYKNN